MKKTGICTTARTIINLLLVSLVIVMGTSQAREMQSGTDAYTFSVYMIDAFYSEGETCEEKLLAAPTIGWLCAAFPLGQTAFEQRWEAYLSALPENYTITAVTSWGDIKYAEDDSSFYGKIYDLNDGRLVVGYDRENRGSEIRLGFSSNANQATSAQPATTQAAVTNGVQTQAVQTQAVQTQVAQTSQAQQQEPVMLTYEQTRALEMAQSETATNQVAQTQAQMAPVAQTQAVTNQRAFSAPNQVQQSAAMATAASTTVTNSPVLNSAQTTASSTAMATAATTNLSTSSVVNAVKQAATITQPQQATSNTVQAATQAQPVATEEVMALAQSTQPAQSSPSIELTASGILDAFQAKGLSVEAEKSMTTKDYGFAPVLANEGLFFRIGDCTSCIGRIFSFDRPEDVSMMEVYYSLEAQATDVVYSQDKVLLQFFSTPKALADEYITELKALN